MFDLEPGFYHIVMADSVDPELVAFLVVGGILFFVSYLVSLLFEGK